MAGRMQGVLLDGRNVEEVLDGVVVFVGMVVYGVASLLEAW